jgi:hypothetical protein
MSPSESDLRAALRHGEGAGLNADHVLVHARAGAAQRRVRLLSAAAIFAVVAGAGVGGAFLANSGGNASDTSAAGAQNAARAPVLAPHATTGGRLDAGTGGTAGRYGAAGETCPVSFSSESAPGRSDSALRAAVFSKPVRVVVLCAYSTSTAAAPAPAATALPASPKQLTLRGAQAAQLAGSLERASTHRRPVMCPNIRTQSRPLVMIGYAANGSIAGMVITNLNAPACTVVFVRNGHTRYGWSPPASLTAVLGRLLVPQRTAGQVTPSPISS